MFALVSLVLCPGRVQEWVQKISSYLCHCDEGAGAVAVGQADEGDREGGEDGEKREGAPPRNTGPA